MRFVPILKIVDMHRSLKFYTEVLDFEIGPYETDLTSPVIELVREGATIQLSSMPGDGVFGIAFNAEMNSVKELDELFEKFLARGLDTSSKAESPVHRGPTNQSWGTREFYVTDPDGNTVRFRAFPE
jgi:catechol 2,3-dioxygenase-like lactoylglutathione lyase family enzyme